MSSSEATRAGTCFLGKPGLQSLKGEATCFHVQTYLTNLQLNDIVMLILPYKKLRD